MGLCCSKQEEQDSICPGAYQPVSPIVNQPGVIIQPIRPQRQNPIIQSKAEPPVVRPAPPASILQSIQPPHLRKLVRPTSAALQSIQSKVLVRPYYDDDQVGVINKEKGNESVDSHLLSEKPVPKSLKTNHNLILELLGALEVPHKHYMPENQSYVLENINPGTSCHRFVMSQFRNRKFNYHYRIMEIKRLWNPFLSAQYALSKAKAGNKFKENYLFHGTGKKALSSLLLDNFNWRMVENAKCGWGVSFANNPWFSSHYSTRAYTPRQGPNYVMIMAKVLVEDGEICLGDNSTKVPPAGYTTTNEKKEVIVKYDDASFYPEFIVYFTDHSYSYQYY